MERAWILLLLTCILAESFASPRGIFINLKNGEICMRSGQCKSGCCHRQSGLSMARCADKAAENQECSRKNIIYGTYYRCPCESGLTCDADWTIVGGITNSDFGICNDPAKRK